MIRFCIEEEFIEKGKLFFCYIVDLWANLHVVMFWITFFCGCNNKLATKSFNNRCYLYIFTIIFTIYLHKIVGFLVYLQVF